MSTVTNVKSGLAKLLATENITVQHNMGAATASFNTETRTVTLPVWKDISTDLYDMLVVHEVGHALYTPATEWLNTIKELSEKHNPKPGDKSMLDRTARSIHSFVNIIEDVRIDIKQRKRYPGAKRNYVIGYKELFERDFFGLKDRPIASESFINRLNVYSKAGFCNVMIVPFTEKEKEYVKRTQETETFADVVELAEEIWLNQRDDQSGEREADGEEADGEEADGDQSGEREANGKEADGDQSGEREANGKEADGDQSGEGNKYYIPEAETDTSFQEALNNISETNGVSYNYCALPEVIGEPWMDYKEYLNLSRDASGNFDFSDYRTSLNNFKLSENKTISFMVKEFELRKSAAAYRKMQFSKTGVINTNKLHSYVYNDDIFKRNTFVPNGKNHGFVMFLDWSGSMQDNIKNTVKQVLSLCLFCRRISVPFDVYTFTSTGIRNINSAQKVFTESSNTLQFVYYNNNQNIINVLSSRMNVSEFNDAMVYLYTLAESLYQGIQAKQYYPPFMHMQGTPLNETIMIAEKIINNFRKQTKVEVANVIFLSDGDGARPRVPVGLYSGYNKKGSAIVIQDTKTRKDYTLPTIRSFGIYESTQNCSWDWTKVMLQILKDRTKCNLIGFYLVPSGGWRKIVRSMIKLSDSQFETMKKSWTANDYVSVDNSGFDEYFIISTKSLDIKETKLKVDTKTMTKRQIIKSFTQQKKKKTTNRVLLGNFIKKIA